MIVPRTLFAQMSDRVTPFIRPGLVTIGSIALLAFGLIGLGVAQGARMLLGVLALPMLIRFPLVLLLSMSVVIMANQTDIGWLRDSLQIARWIPLCIAPALVAFKLLTPGAHLRRVKPFDWLAALWILAAMASSYFSPDPSLTFQRAASLLLMYLTVFWWLWDAADRYSGETVAYVLVGGFLIVLIPGGVLALFESGLMQSDGRLRGVLENPNALGILTSLFVPLGVGLTFHKPSLLLSGVTALFCVTLVLTGSRGGLLAAAVGVGYILVFTRGVKVWVVALALIPVGLWTIDLTAFTNSWLQSSYFRLSTLQLGSGRLEVWPIALQLIEARPVLGYGFGTEEMVFGVAKEGYRFIEYQGGYIHNSYLGLALQSGLVGCVAFFTPVFLLAARTMRSPIQRASATVQHALTGALVAGLVAAFFESWVYSMGNAEAFPFWAIVMLVAHSQTSPTGGRLAPAVAQRRQSPLA